MTDSPFKYPENPATTTTGGYNVGVVLGVLKETDEIVAVEISITYPNDLPEVNPRIEAVYERIAYADHIGSHFYGKKAAGVSQPLEKTIRFEIREAIEEAALRVGEAYGAQAQASMLEFIDPSQVHEFTGTQYILARTHRASPAIAVGPVSHEDDSEGTSAVRNELTVDEITVAPASNDRRRLRNILDQSRVVNPRTDSNIVPVGLNADLVRLRNGGHRVIARAATRVVEAVLNKGR